MKAVLISIKPKWCELIASGTKTVEVRKTRPKIDTPFKCYIYCTSAKKHDENLWTAKNATIGKFADVSNGKVIGEFVCDNISVFEYKGGGYLVNGDISTTISIQAQSCLTDYQFRKYAGEKSCYGWHISDLVVYDKPKELNEFKQCHVCEYMGVCENTCWKPLQRAPQSWCYVEELEADK